MHTKPLNSLSGSDAELSALPELSHRGGSCIFLKGTQYVQGLQAESIDHLPRRRALG